MKRKNPALGLRAPGAVALSFAVLSACGGDTSPVAVAPPPPSLGVPQNLQVTNGADNFRGDDFIEWQWDAVPGAAGYQVEVSVADDDFNPPDQRAVLGANETSVRFPHEPLPSGTAVYLRVQAFGGSQASPVHGPFSDPVGGITGIPPVDSDRGRLVLFYVTTGGREVWTTDTGWLTPAPLGDWYGVETDGGERVVRLSLADNGLSGELPAELGELAKLEHLNLRDNHFGSFFSLRGGVPPELGQLTNLKYLNLSGSDLSGEIPPELGQLKNLEHLILGISEFPGGGSIAGNALSGVIPRELGQLTNLRSLDLSGNDLSGEIPREIGGIVNLERLDLSGNDLSGEIPPELGELTNLRSLDLSHYGSIGLSGAVPREIGALANLEHLNLRGNALNGAIPPELGQLAKLGSLRLGDNDLNGGIPTELGQLTNLEYLDLQGNALSGPIPRELGQLLSLNELWLMDNRLRGAIPPELGQLTNLEVLALEGNPALAGPISRALTNLTALRWLFLPEETCVPQGGRFDPWVEGIENFRGSRCPQ